MQQSNWMILQFSCFLLLKEMRNILLIKNIKKTIILKREARILFISIFVLY